MIKCTNNSLTLLGAILILIALQSIALYGQTHVPLLGKPEKILINGKPLELEGTPAPLVYDFNRDGKNDLIVGEFPGDKARIYLNIGTKAEPKFETYAYLQADGEDAVIEGG
ncbi:MAG: hypothetical protein V1799_15480 [bacterium]